MGAADAPGLRRYLHAAAFWLATALTTGFALLFALPGPSRLDSKSLIWVSLPSLAVAIIGTALLRFSFVAGIRTALRLAVMGVLVGFALTAAAGFAAAYVVGRPDPALWLLLVPGNVVGGGIAGASLARAVPREQDWWPSQRSW